MRGIMRAAVRELAGPIASLLVLVCGCANVAMAQTAAAPLRLQVDASQAPQKLLHVHMEIPVSGGPVTLYYPEWIPGEHMPDGPIIQVAGMKFSGGGKDDRLAARFGRDVFDSCGRAGGSECP